MSVWNLLACVAVLLVLRIAIILSGGQLEAPGGDPLAFYSDAQRLTGSLGEWTKGGGEFGYRAPMYFVYLTAVFSVVPQSTFLTAQVANAFLGVLNCVLVYILVRNLTSNAGGKLGFWLRGLLPSYVVADTFVMSESLFAAFLLSALVVISLEPKNPNSRQATMLGFLIACCLLTREVAMVYPIIFCGYLIMATDSLVNKIKYVSLFLLALVVTLLPWMLRNEVVWGKPLPISYTSGVNLYIGNNIHATGKWMSFSSDSDKSGHAFGTPQSDAWYRKEALRYIQEDPLRFVKMGFKKVAWYLWPRFEREEIKELYKLPPKLAIFVSGMAGCLSAAIMIMGLAGFVFGPRDWFWWISLSLFSYAVLVAFVVFGSPRFRDLTDCLLLIFAANIIVRRDFPWKAIWERRAVVQNQLRALLVVYFFLFLNWTWIGYDLVTSGV